MPGRTLLPAFQAYVTERAMNTLTTSKTTKTTAAAGRFLVLAG
jgi:hypothetical protein